MKKQLMTLSMALGVAATVAAQTHPGNFSQDAAFLKRHTKVVVLSNGTARVAVAPSWQGRVMTSAFAPKDAGFGWMNYSFIESGKLVPHMNVFGGEDRLWLGPEGGQFALFFKKGGKFDLTHWQTPPFMDTMPFRVVSKTADSVTCERRDTLANFSGTQFHVKATRTVKLLPRSQVLRDLGVKVGPSVKVVGYESVNRLTNTGNNAWNESTGMPSIWILGQFNNSPTTTVVAPYRPGPQSKLGIVVNDTYFGKVPADRLKVGKSAVFFKADGQYRSKIGVNPRRALNAIGSYDSAAGVLTIIQFTHPKNATKYVNSMWEIQKRPFGGDLVNSYNDGPPAPGKKPLGPFYEIESSSPAAKLAPGSTIVHVHRTIHVQGPKDELEKIAQKELGVGLDEIASAFGGQ